MKPDTRSRSGGETASPSFTKVGRVAETSGQRTPRVLPSTTMPRCASAALSAAAYHADGRGTVISTSGALMPVGTPPET
jgi:hypothetical protein